VRDGAVEDDKFVDVEMKTQKQPQKFLSSIANVMVKVQLTTQYNSENHDKMRK
jgi:hypothetical protein